MSVRGLLTGVGIGALGMYYLDPERGRRRRSLMRDQCDSTIQSVEEFLDVTVRDLNNRVQGCSAELSAMFQHDEAPDRVVEARVRSKLGRYVSHPRAIEVSVRDGQLTLSGPILAHEIRPLVTAMRHVRGVQEVHNELEGHEDAGNISSLQGGIKRSGEHYGVLQETWSPATRLIALSSGMGLMLNCFARRGFSSALGGAIGLGIFVRAATNQRARMMLNPRPAHTGGRPQQLSHTASEEHSQQ